MVQNCQAKEYRQSPHAGSWYPGNKNALTNQIQTFLEKVRVRIHGDIYGLISPHAGYVFSGPVAAHAYKTVKDHKFDAVIVIGPSHYHGFNGASVDTMAGRNTPLGKIEYDLDLAHKLIDNNRHIAHIPAAHQQEHSTEIQVPFLQTVLNEFKLVEIVMGSHDYNSCENLSKAIVKATNGQQVLIVASSDLSHYHSQQDAEKLDQRVIESVASFDPKMLAQRLRTDSCEACGGGPIITAMMICKTMGASTAKPVMYATSGNISGDYSRGVVGYLAAVLYTEKEIEVGLSLGLSDQEKARLKQIAKESIEAAVKGEKLPEYDDVTGNLTEQYGIFVTINKHGNLRGCIGHIIGNQPLYLLCQQMAKSAALNDPRFPPVNEKELPDLEIEVSVLTPLEKVTDFNDIEVGRDGLLIRKGYAQGLLLPQVAAGYGWSAEEFLEQTCHKAGLPANAYQDSDAEVFKFSAEVF